MKLFEFAEYAFLNIFGMCLVEKRVDFVIKHQQQGRMFHRQGRMFMHLNSSKTNYQLQIPSDTDSISLI